MSVSWSVNTLALDCQDEVNVMRGTTLGAATDRLKVQVRSALRDLWCMEPWVWQARSGTLSVSASATTATLPLDFRCMDARWVKDNDKTGWLPFTGRQSELDMVAANYDTGDTDTPQIALITRNIATTTSILWYVRLAPAAAEAFSYDFSYLAKCPLDLAADHAQYCADATEVPLESFFANGWEKLAKLYVHRRFSQKSTGLIAQAKDAWQDWYKTARANNDAALATPIGHIIDGYEDLQNVANENYPTRDELTNLPGY